jgi:LuxR family maltose regulon positive regulatory protein
VWDGALPESKLSPPVLPSRTVPRKTLLGTLRRAKSVPFVTVVAPSGFGKTTLAAQWAARDRRPFVWLTLDAHDDDVARLVHAISRALAPMWLQGAGGTGEAQMGDLGTVADLGTTVRHIDDPFVLVLDDAHLVRDPVGVDVVVAVADNLPAGSQVLVLGRGAVALPMAQLRADERVLELGGADLRMDGEEAGELLRLMDLDLSRPEVEEVGELTEGWPAALHLAGLSLREERFDRRSTIRHIRQTESVVGYLRSEFLAGMSRGELSFLTRTSVLDTLSGPVCDALLQRTGSDRVLQDLARRNMLLVPLDQHGEHYRYHRLLRQLLRADLDRKDPERAEELLRRAAVWCEEQGRIGSALDYAVELGDTELAARLLGDHAMAMHRQGGDFELVRWLVWFEERELLERYPEVAAIGAWVYAFLGRAATVQRWAEAAERGGASDRPGTDRARVEALLSLLRAAQCRSGPERMERDAEQALRLVPGRSEVQPGALLLAAVARRLQGAAEEADPLFVEAFEVAMDHHAYPAAVLALGERARLAAEQDDWMAADDLVRRAMLIVHEAGLEDYATTTLVDAIAARVAVREGDLAAGKEHLARAQRLRGDVTHAIPFLAVELRLELARTFLALTDSAGARSMLRELESLFALRRDLGVLRRDADDVHAQVSSVRATFVGGSSLTTAELRLLPMLATHYSFREIADRLYVSRHTVKTQAISIYRKLRVTSRSEAVESARRTGLLAA